MKWPRSPEPARWYRCIADVALALDPNDESRHYAHFTIERFIGLGLRRDALRVIRALEATPPTDVVRLVMDCEAIASAWLDLGEAHRVSSAFARLPAVAARQKRKSDGAYVLSAESKFRTKEGLLSADALAALPSEDFVKAHRNLAWRASRRGQKAEARKHARLVAERQPKVNSVELLTATGALADAKRVWKSLKASDRESAELATLLAVGAPAVRIVKARANEALSKLVESEWNLHFVVGSIRKAHDELVRVGQPKQAKALLAETLRRFATGRFDSRGFASAGAYLTLGQMTGDAALIAQGHALLGERSGHEAVELLLERGEFYDARVKAGREPKLLAKVAFAARDWSGLSESLNALDPVTQLRVTWAFRLRS